MCVLTPGKSLDGCLEKRLEMTPSATTSIAANIRVLKNSAETATTNKFRRYRLRKQHQELGPVGCLYTHCRYCDREIKPSYLRGFCPGGECRDSYFKTVRVLRLVPITIIDNQISTRIVEAKKGETDKCA